MSNLNSIMENSQIVRSITPKRLFLSKLRRKILRHVWLTRIGLLFLITAALIIFFSISSLLLKKSKISFYGRLATNFLFPKESTVNVIGDRVNILILGKGGGSHEAPDLTDTMILASISVLDNKISLLNLPRDIWISDLRTKLNSIYYWGNKKKEGGGKALAKSVVEEITGLPVQYSMVVDFEGFTKFVDSIGGIDVEVETSFTDEKYPIEGKENDECKEDIISEAKLDRVKRDNQVGLGLVDGDDKYKCRYETITFNKGKTHMNGEMALKFVRSRNAQGDEGTDFARGKRQEKVILAIVKKVLSSEILLHPKKILVLKNEALKYLETDITPNEGAYIARKVVSGRKNITNLPFPEDFLVNPPKLSKYDNLYVLIPKNGDWEEIKSWTSCKLDGMECD